MKVIFLSLLIIIFIIILYNDVSSIDHFTDISSFTPDLSETIDTINKEIGIESLPNKPEPIDLNKYILKTQIPVCPKQINMDDYIEKKKFPDMSKYILKTQLPICPKQINMDNYIEKNQFPDMSKYILKTKLPICPKIPDLSKFVLKSSIPPPKRCVENSLTTSTIDSLSISNINKASCKLL